MNLRRELDGRLIRRVVENGSIHLRTVERLEDAHGVMYLCPGCFKRNGGSVRTHGVLNWFADRGVPADEKPLPGRWVPAGTTIDDLTFVGPAAASVLLVGCPTNWHGFVRNGEAA